MDEREIEARAPMTEEHIRSLVGVAQDVCAMVNAARARRPSIVMSGGYAEADAIVRLGEEVLALRAENATTRREGAEAMRERCAAELKRRADARHCEAMGFDNDDIMRDCHEAAAGAIDDAMLAIRAFSLDPPTT